jgi:asparagine synthase (glutamine-hydrolysing)
MPGIVGIISRSKHLTNRAEIDAMVECMLHEKFYVSGTFFNEQLGLSAGWISHSGSFSDCLPIWNEAEDICLIFSGEDFRDRSEIDQLRAKGHKFDSTNASYLVHLYEEMGLEFLGRMNGWFSGLLVYLREQKVFLFNDRYGLGRICYHEHEGALYFSSEAKSLLKVLPKLRALDPKSLGEYFSCGSVLQNRTLFSGVSLLPGGSVWTVSKDQPIKKGSYFQQGLWEELPTLSESQYYEKLKETWERILPRYFRENEQCGLSLTGGLDSRMILAWAPFLPGELPCYTFGGRYRDCNDVKIARQLARLSQQPHQIIHVGREFLSEFPALAEKSAYITDGNLDASGTIDLFVQRRARQIAPIRITGTNGGELLRRHIAFKPMHLREDLFEVEMGGYISAAASTYAEERNCHRLSFTAFKQAPWHMNSKFVLERSQITLRMPYFDNELTMLSYQVPPQIAQANGPALRLIADGNRTLGRIGTDRALHLAGLPGVGKARHLVQEFTFKAEYAYDHGMPQWLARLDHSLAPLHLERVVLGRHKFHHFRVYYRDELSRYLQEILLDPRTLSRPFIRKGVLEEVVRGHATGHSNYTLEIHKLLTIELAQRQLIDRN